MSDRFSDSSRPQPKKTVVEPDRNKPPRTAFVRKDPLEGKTLGDNNRYLLQTLLGQGGMSKVYQALDTKLENKVVAIKLMTHYSATANRYLVKRFMGEIKAISRLKHPNIIQIFDFGITSDGAPFYVMEHLEGLTLQSLLSQNSPISFDFILNIIHQVIAGLKQAHDKGIIHRDLKPDNIFLVEGSGFGKLVKIIDFGIAKNINPDAENSTQLTVEGSFIGTYRYASPEQCRGEIGIDRRSDIYSLGIILYEAICGQNPYGMNDDLIISQADWIASHLKASPKPIKQQPGCEHLADELADIIMKCLAKSPEDRFLNLEELQNALNALLLGEINNNIKADTGISNNLSGNISDFKTEVEAQPTPNKTVAEENNSTSNLTVESDRTAISVTSSPQVKSRRKVLKYGGLVLLGISLTTILAKIIEPSSDRPIAKDKQPAKIATEAIDLVNSIQMSTSEEVWSLAISPDSKLIASGSDRGKLELYDRHTGKLNTILGQHENVIRSLAFIPQTNLLVAGDGDGYIKIWNRQNNSLERQLTAHSASIWSLVVSPDGQILISSSEDESIRIWSLTTGETQEIIFSHETVVYALAFSPDGRVFASGGKDKIVKIWDVRDRTLLQSLSGHQDAIRAIAISPDGKYLVSGSWDKTVRVWELQSGKLITTFEGHRDRVVALAIAKDSRTVFSGSIDNTINVWSIENAKSIATLSQHNNWVLALATSLQENLLVSGGKDNTIKLWQY